MTDAVTLFAQAMRFAIAARGVGLVALSGGNTPRETYRAMAKLDLPWEKIVARPASGGDRSGSGR